MGYRAKSPGELAQHGEALGLGDMVNAARLRRMQGSGGTGRKFRPPIGHLLFLRKVLHPGNILEI